jgi:hypothetical protein
VLRASPHIFKNEDHAVPKLREILNFFSGANRNGLFRAPQSVTAPRSHARCGAYFRAKLLGFAREQRSGCSLNDEPVKGGNEEAKASGQRRRLAAAGDSVQDGAGIHGYNAARALSRTSRRVAAVRPCTAAVADFTGCRDKVLNRHAWPGDVPGKHTPAAEFRFEGPAHDVV